MSNTQPLKILTLDSSSPLQELLSERLQRIGIQEKRLCRALPEPPLKSRGFTEEIEYYLGELDNPLTLLFACRDVDGLIIDLSAPHPELVELTSSPQERAIPPEKSPWEGPQRWLGGQLLSLVGRRGSPVLTPTHHSASKNPEECMPEDSIRDISPLGAALSTVGVFQSYERPLTFISPVEHLVKWSSELLSAVAFDAYRRAGWRPRLLCYDWVVSHPLTTHKLSEALKGDASPYLAELIREIILLRARSLTTFNALIAGQLNPPQSGASLSLIGGDDLISAILLTHQHHSLETRSRAQGAEMTQGSLITSLALLIDDLTETQRERLLDRLGDKIPRALQAQTTFKELFTTAKTLLSPKSLTQQRASKLRLNAPEQVIGTKALLNHIAPLKDQPEKTPAQLILQNAIDQLLASEVQ